MPEAAASTRSKALARCVTTAAPRLTTPAAALGSTVWLLARTTPAGDVGLAAV